MEPTISDKKRYNLLLCLYILTAFLIPLVGSSVSYVLMKVSLAIYLQFMNSILNLISVSGSIGFGTVIFSFVRYDFRKCLRFIAVSIMTTAISMVLPILIMGFDMIQALGINTLIGFLMFIISFARLFVYFFIIKAALKLLKNKTATVFAAFLMLLLAEFITKYSNRHLALSLMLTYKSITPLLITLKNMLIAAITYLVLLFLSEKQKRDSAKTILKKLWELTAK